VLLHYRVVGRWVNEVEVPQSASENLKQVQVVAVALDVGALSSAPERLMERLTEDLSALSKGALILLPPLMANIMILPGLERSRSIAQAVRRASSGRWKRRLGVWFTYPHARAHRRPWLVMHDRVHRALRVHIGGFAQALKASVVGGTVVLSHPRTHWEAWPDHGELFHTSWSFGPDGEPYDVVRQPRCRLGALSDAKLDGNEELELRPLHTQMVDVSPLWDSAAPEAPIMWFPEVRLEHDEAPDLEALRARYPGATLFARTSLCGRLGGQLRGSAQLTHVARDGEIHTLCAESPAEERGFSWVETTIQLPQDYETKEPTGAP